MHILYVINSFPPWKVFLYLNEKAAMAITKQQKLELVSGYTTDLAQAKNVVLVKQSGVPVNDSNTLRMSLVEV